MQVLTQCPQLSKEDVLYGLLNHLKFSFDGVGKNDTISGYCEERIICNFELLYFYNAAGTAVIQGQPIPIEKGDLLLFRPFVKHNYFTTEGHEFFWLHFDIVPMHLQNVLFSLTPFCNQNAKINIGTNDLYIAFFRKLLSHVADSTPGYRSLGDLTVRMLLLDLILQNPDVPSQQIAIPSSRGYQLFEKAVGYINDNIDKPITPKLLCQKMNISTAYLYRCFQKVVGIGPAQYIKLLKLKKASFLLLTTDKAINEIADLLSFSSPYLLSAEFKQSFGCSPKFYRRKYVTIQNQDNVHATKI